MSLAGLITRFDRRRAAKADAGVPWWPVVLPLVMMLASDYKLRSREAGASLSGSADLTVLFEIAVYGGVALFLYRRFGLRPPTRRTTGLMFMAWAWTSYLALSALWSPYPAIAVVRAAQALVTMAVCQVLATRATPGDLQRLAHAFIVVVVLSIGIGIVHPFPRTHLTQDRFNWLYVHPVACGIYLGAAVLLTAAFLIRRQIADRRWAEPGSARPWPLPIYVVCLMIVTGGLVATGTRGAALGCVVGLAVLLATAKGPRGRVDLLVIGTAVGTVAVLGFAEEIMAFATRGESAESLATLNSRTDLWSLALAAVAEQPLFGYGLGATRGLFLRDLGLGGGHNAFVNALVDGGAVGVAIFVVLLLTLSVVLLKMIRHLDLRADSGLLLGLVAFFAVDGITTEHLAAPANAAGIWLLIMVAWAETLRRNRAPQPLDGVAAPAHHHQPGSTEDDQRAQ